MTANNIACIFVGSKFDKSCKFSQRLASSLCSRKVGWKSLIQIEMGRRRRGITPASSEEKICFCFLFKNAGRNHVHIHCKPVFQTHKGNGKRLWRTKKKRKRVCLPVRPVSGLQRKLKLFGRINSQAKNILYHTPTLSYEIVFNRQHKSL